MSSVLGASAKALRLGRLAALGLAALALAGCTLKMTGGGELNSAVDPDSTAHFAIDYSASRPGIEPAHLTGVYKDGPVSLRFDGVDASPEIPDRGSPQSQSSVLNCIAVTGKYVSQSPTATGTGTAMLIACAGSAGLPDLLSLNVQSGPFAGYQNSGPITAGELTAHSA